MTILSLARGMMKTTKRSPLPQSSAYSPPTRSSSIDMLPLSDIRDGTFTFNGNARGNVRSADITGSMTADVTVHFYLFTRGQSAGTNSIDARFENIRVGGRGYGRGRLRVSPAYRLVAAGRSTPGACQANCMGLQMQDKVAPTKSEGGVSTFMLNTLSGVGRPNATGTWSASR